MREKYLAELIDHAECMRSREANLHLAQAPIARCGQAIHQGQESLGVGENLFETDVVPRCHGVI